MILATPPFGHEGETALNACMAPYGGFEGNAQTLRLLTVIEKKIASNTDGPLIDNNNDYRAGLNLSFRSLAAVLKYDRKIPEKFEPADGVQKGYYASEQELVNLIKTKVSQDRKVPSGFKTIECQIMDIADDIAYSTYDLDDALKSGLIRAPDDGVSPVFAEIYLEKDVWIKIETLKHLTFHFLIHSPRWKVVAWRSKEIVRYLFTTLTSNNDHELMPDDCKQLYDLYQSDASRHRVVCDFIACMTDTYAVEFYSRLQSDRPSSFFKPL